MKLHIPHTAILATLMALVISCSGNRSVESLEESIRQAERAVAKGEMTAAKSVSDKILGEENLSRLSPSQIGRLSMVYMQIADSLDQPANTDTAADLYERAYKINADSAETFYQTIGPERLQYVAALSARSAHRNNPVDMANIPDEESATDSIDSLFNI